MHEQQSNKPKNICKVYVKPQILHEIDLETRAGSPTNLGDPFHVLDLDFN